MGQKTVLEKLETQENFQVPLLGMKMERANSMNVSDLSKLRITTADILRGNGGLSPKSHRASFCQPPV